MLRLKLFAAAAFLLIVGSTVCAEDKAVSDTLLKELKQVIGSMIEDAKREGVAMPPGATVEQLETQTVAVLKPVLLVSADEENKFKKGEFDEEGNKKRMDQFPKLFADLKAELPKVAVIFIQENKIGKLSGARLELAVRINQSVADKVKAAEKR
jgi:hypothetical protein